jgi:hypothetical protein
MHAWGTIQLTGFDTPPVGLADLAVQHHPTYSRFKAYRSEVLEACIFLESRLEVLLCQLFVGEAPVRIQLFRSLVLEPETGSFFAKWRMLRGAFELVGVPRQVLTEAKRKKLLSGLKDLNDCRNRFAHGVLYIDVRDGRPLLEYHESGKKHQYLTDEYVKSVLQAAEETHALLEVVINAAGEP